MRSAVVIAECAVAVGLEWFRSGKPPLAFPIPDEPPSLGEPRRARHREEDEVATFHASPHQRAIPTATVSNGSARTASDPPYAAATTQRPLSSR